MSWLLNTVAVSKVKEASFDTAVQVGRLLADCMIEDVPLALFVESPCGRSRADECNRMAWVIFPIAVYSVCLNRQSTSLPWKNLSPHGHLIKLIRGMKHRFQGVQYVSEVVKRIVDNIETAAPEWTQDAYGPCP